MGFFRDTLGAFNDLSTPWRFSADEWRQKIEDAPVGSPIHGLKAGYTAAKWGSLNTGNNGGSISPAYNLYSNAKGLLNGSQTPGNQISGYAGNANEALKTNAPAILAFLGGAYAGVGGGGASGVADTGGSAAVSDLGVADTGGSAAVSDLGVAADGSIVPASEGVMGAGGDMTGLASSGSGAASSGGSGVGSYLKAGSAGYGLLSQRNQQTQTAPVIPTTPQNTQAQQAARIRMAMELQRQQLLMKPNKTLQDYLQLSQLKNQQGLLGQGGQY